MKILTKATEVATLIHTYIHTYIHKLSERGFKLRTRIPLFRMWGDWYYLVSVTRDVLC